MPADGELVKVSKAIERLVKVRAEELAMLLY